MVFKRSYVLYFYKALKIGIVLARFDSTLLLSECSKGINCCPVFVQKIMDNVIVCPVYRKMPNLTAIEVAKAHLAAKDKQKQDAAREKTAEEDTRKNKVTTAKGSHRKNTQKDVEDRNLPAKDMQTEDTAIHNSEIQV